MQPTVTVFEEIFTPSHTVTKSELIQALKDKLPELQTRDLELTVNCILTQMTDALTQDEHIEIRGFGSFDLLPDWLVILKQVQPFIHLLKLRFISKQAKT